VYSEAFYNPFRFVGKFGVLYQGYDLHHMRARDYNVGIRRFIQKDPYWGDKWSPGTLNRYAYVGDNPVNWVDPYGLWYVDVNITGGIGRGGATGGVQIGPAGLFVYGGVGIGSGRGVSVTINTGDPSPGLNPGIIVSGGTGEVGGLLSHGYKDIDFPGGTDIGVGWGVGFGLAITGKYTYPISEWGNPKKDDDCD
jgi:RHS repeat-associated protein